MGVVFSKLSGKNDGFYKAVEGVLTEHIIDVDKKKNNDDKVLEAIFRVQKSKKHAERQGGMTEFGNFEEVGEGGVAIRDEIEEGFAKLIEHCSFSKDFAITREMASDANSGDFNRSKLVSANFMAAYKRSKLDFGTAFLTAEGATFRYNGKAYDRTTGDKKGMFATDHPGKRSGVPAQSNVFTNELGTTSETINRLANIGRNFMNESGIASGYEFDTVILPSNRPKMEQFVKKLIGSDREVGTNLNDMNTEKNGWKLIVNHRWIVTENNHDPYILASSEANQMLNALPFYNREDLDIMSEVDRATRNLVFNGYTRFSCGCYNWRAFLMGGAKTGTTLT